MHPGQLTIIDDPARFKMVRAGRRFRKSGTGTVQAFWGYRAPDRQYLGALTGGQIGWYVPSMTTRYLVADWLPIKGLAIQIAAETHGAARVEEANHRVTMPGGGSIIMLSGDNIDSGRGLGLDGVVIDEASLLNEQLWSETIRATLMDNEGWALFLFTPKGLRWPHQLELDSQRWQNWKTFHFTSHDNPFLKPSEIAEMTAELPSLVVKQEIDAEYVTGGAGLFEREWIRYWWLQDGKYWLGDRGVAPEECWQFSTVDLAWSLEERADFTVISTWAVTKRRELILLDVIRQHIAGPDLVPILRGVRERFDVRAFIVERASKQLPIMEDISRSGLPVREVKANVSRSDPMQGDAKVARAIPATARMEQGKVWFPRPSSLPVMRECEAELLAFPLGSHDDFVDTLSYAAIYVGSNEKGYLMRLD